MPNLHALATAPGGLKKTFASLWPHVQSHCPAVLAPVSEPDREPCPTPASIITKLCQKYRSFIRYCLLMAKKHEEFLDAFTRVRARAIEYQITVTLRYNGCSFRGVNLWSFRTLLRARARTREDMNWPAIKSVERPQTRRQAEPQVNHKLRRTLHAHARKGRIL